MKKPFGEYVQERVLIADGGMGSEIYARGFYINSCYDELNLSNAQILLDIHESFAKAGAEILTTNTFGANRLSLHGFGLNEKLAEINRQGVNHARKAGGEAVYVAGAIGPITEDLAANEDRASLQSVFAEQAAVLAEAGADLITLESFQSLDQLEWAYEAAAGAASGLPVIPSLSCQVFAQSQGATPAEVVRRVRGWGARMLGLNGGGPAETLDLLPRYTEAAGGDLRFYVRPSAGHPKMIGGRLLYLASPEYMAEHTRRYVQKGAAIVGGDSGITPKMIREMCSFLRSIQPGKRISIQFEHEELPPESMTPIPLESRSPFGQILGKKFAISVELDPPKGVIVTKSVQGAKFLYDHGIDAVNIADGPRASGRMSPIALGLLVRREVPIETIVHVCCRDRNVLALQMDLISANALGLHNLMLITGDPPKMGLYPDATAVFDFDAVGLISHTNLLNHGLDFARRPLKGQTEFVLGMGCNPGAPDLETEVRRYEEKVNAGADFVFSQPIYDPALLEEYLKRIRHVRPIPFFVGILPLASYKNAEFLHNEVPGMQVPSEIRERMRKASTKEAQREEGIRIAAEALREASRYPQIRGSYIFPPFGRYASILDVLEIAGVR